MATPACEALGGCQGCDCPIGECQAPFGKVCALSGFTVSERVPTLTPHQRLARIVEGMSPGELRHVGAGLVEACAGEMKIELQRFVEAAKAQWGVRMRQLEGGRIWGVTRP